MLRRLLSKLKCSKLKDGSTLKAICSILSAEELSNLLQNTDDWRLILDLGAEIKNEPVAKFGERVARALGVKFVERVPAFDPWLLPKKFSADAFMTVGAYPLFSNGVLSQIVCVDPSRLGDIGQAFATLPKKLSNWRTIEPALKAESTELTPSAIEDRVTHLISLMVSEALEYESQSLTLSFKEKNLEYSFITKDGKPAQGSASNLLKFPLLSRLSDALRSEGRSIQVTARGSVETYLVEAKSSSVYELRRDAVEKSAETTPHTHLKCSAKVEQLEPEQSNLQSATARDKSAQFNYTIALIDDDVTFSLVVARFFERGGVKVVSFSSPKDALREIKSKQISPDAILCDLHMPELSGLEVMKAIKATAETSSIPFILLTSDDQTETEIRAVTSGVDAFLSKSDEPMLLAAYVQRFLKSEKKAA